MLRGTKMPTRKVARLLADLEDALVEEGLSEEQAEGLVDRLERKVDKHLAELDGDDGSCESDDKDGTTE